MTTAVPAWKVQLLAKKREKEVEEEKRRKEEEGKAAKVARSRLGPSASLKKPSTDHGPSGKSLSSTNKTNAAGNNTLNGPQQHIVKSSPRMFRTGGSTVLESVEENASPERGRASPTEVKMNDAQMGASAKDNVKVSRGKRPTVQELRDKFRPIKLKSMEAGQRQQEQSPSSPVTNVSLESRAIGAAATTVEERETFSPRGRIASAPAKMISPRSMDELSSLECTLVDDVTVHESFSKLLTIDNSPRERAIHSEPTTPQSGSPRQGRRRSSILSPRRSGEQKGMGSRRVSFPELHLATIVHFQRDSSPSSSEGSADEADTKPHGASRQTVSGEHGLATELHHSLSPRSKKETSKFPSGGRKRTMNQSIIPEDEPPDLYTGVSDELAQLMA